MGINGSTWSTILGTDRVRDIDDRALREDLAFLMTADYSQIDQASLDTPYRHNVRRIIPIEIQDAVRTHCGDRPQPGHLAILALPPACSIVILPASATKAAALLRAHPELLEDLQAQVAAVAVFQANIVPYEAAARRIQKEIGRRR